MGGNSIINNSSGSSNNNNNNNAGAPAATPAVQQNFQSSADPSPGPVVALIGQMLPDFSQ